VTSATSAAPGSNRSITCRIRNGSWVPQRLPFPIYSDGLSKNTRMAFGLNKLCEDDYCSVIPRLEDLAPGRLGPGLFM
jgi:hypothetical protein